MSHRKRVPDSSQFPPCSSAAHQLWARRDKEKRNEHELVKTLSSFACRVFTTATTTSSVEGQATSFNK
eukprot:scaffold14400_cov132-Skeletonema_marinoi.AAC.14